jgi:hypothetical protein
VEKNAIRINRLLLIVALILISQKGFSQGSCHTMAVHERMLQQYPSFAANQKKLEDITKKNPTQIQNHGTANARVATLTTIPVVVHILYNAPGDNISDAQVLSQIQALNEDYSKSNADASLIPASFSIVAANSNIQFCLAKRTPAGDPSTGITRTYTPFTSFDDTDPNQPHKFSALGGHDIWDRDKYLNIWVCNLSGNLAGYAQFPGGPSATDGVVIDHLYFGTTGTLDPNYQKGRVTTHEVGHWLNLRHIWGDSKCGDDFVYDTPTQERATFGCPSFPYPSCNNASDMYMNYMDYSNDNCKDMFTYGQSQRMSTALSVMRSSLMTSDGCTPTIDYCTSLPEIYNFGGATITDGSMNNNYKNNTDCQWLIQPSVGGIITLTFQSFATELNYDTLFVYDGPTTSSSLLGKYTGATLPPVLTSTGSKVLLRFLTNATNTAAGWSVTYISSNADNSDWITCRGTTTYTGATGTVSDGSGNSNYSKNLDCEYLIQPPGANSVTLHFTQFSTEKDYDFVKIYDGSSAYSPLLGIYSGTNLPADLTTSSGAVLLRFVTDDFVNNTGWTLNYTTNNAGPSSCSGTTVYSQYTGTVQDGSGAVDYTDQLDCLFLIQPPGATSVTTHFTAFDTESGYDSIIVYDGPTIFYPVLGTYSGSVLPPDITAASGVMLIRFITDEYVFAVGWSATYTSTGTGGSPCVGLSTYTAANGSIEDGSGTSSNYTNNTNCKFLISPQGASVITLHFTSFATETGFDYVKVYNGPTDASEVLGIYSGAALPPDVIATKGSMLVEFISDELTVTSGWSATYTSMAGAVNIGSCNGLQTFTSPSGKISDGSGEYNYQDNSDCMFLIQPANATSITLEFLTFDTENDFDFVRVYDGTTTSAPLLGTFSGIGLPPVITSSGGAILIHFTSDNVTSAAGWYATYNAVTAAASGQCNGLVTYNGPSGTITDGSGGASYGLNQNCQFLIQPTGVSNISLSFTSFETELNFDFVKIYDGASVAAPLKGTYSGINLPPSITSSGSALFIVFTTDNVNSYKGWSLNYTSTVSSNAMICSGLTTYTAPTGTLTDGSGQYNYSNNMNCRFLIQPAGATGITLHFNSYNTESGNDFVNIYNGISSSSPLIGAFSGATIPSDITANSGIMLIEFTSNTSNTRAGWDATYTTSYITQTEDSSAEERVFIYPNPAEKEVVIKGRKSSFTGIKIINTMGETVFASEGIQVDNEYKINVSEWTQGIYYILISNEKNNIKIEKFIKY